MNPKGTSGPRRLLAGRLTMRQLEWLAALVPWGFLVIYHLVLVSPTGHRLLHSGPGFIVLNLSLGAVIGVFAHMVFRTISRMQAEMQTLSQVSARQNSQLRALNEANIALAEERLVSSVLQRVVDLSREVVQSRYAALSVFDDEDGITAFLTSGIDQKTREILGPPTVGRGLLGQIAHETRPLRLDRMQDHPASVGFPPNHPPMTSFLGVPIR
ncbi:MAG: GAF domain-containing protein [SAR202 cluster bacterium]|nr:GAF domain-containing protein [SAR202 cluster bacterium]